MDNKPGSGSRSGGSGDERREGGRSPTPPPSSGVITTHVITHDVKENNNVVTSTPVHKTNGTLNNYNEVSLTPDLSPLKSIKDELNKGSSDLVDGEVKKKRNTSDKAYFIAKEILMTERTYRKDLEVINLWWRDEVCKEECPPCVDALLNLLDPLHDAHCLILRDVELRLAAWETRNSHQQRIADILLRSCDYLPLYENYIDRHLEVLEQLDTEFRTNPKFEQIYRDFESQKICYLPLTAFVLKPLHRIFHYVNLLDRLLKHYSKDHIDYEDCLSARDRLCELQPNLAERLRHSENLVALCELQRDTVGFDHLSSPHRQFLRQGCLNKFSTRKGYLQRMFFLFSDVLLYTNRVGHMFSVHGQLPLHTLAIEERCDTPTANSFIIYGGNRVLTLAASSEEEKDKWLEDLTEAIDFSKNLPNDEKISYLSLKSCSSSDDVMDKCGTEDHKVSPQRSNTTVHVCWHRNTSLSMEDILRAAHNTLSGYLLRKFKNSNGWQKLWVVFTNFCLFFYKTFQDDCPLASLPLLGYTVSPPSDKDAIHKDFVFKLQFKNHVYFFRAESEYTFGRWMEVISSATQHAGRTRLFSRKDSALDD